MRSYPYNVGQDESGFLSFGISGEDVRVSNMPIATDAPQQIASLFDHIVDDTAQIGIGGSLAAPPLPHHRAYGSVHGGSLD
jgi:hypothetical protein